MLADTATLPAETLSACDNKLAERPWGDREKFRHQFRVGLFQRRGLDEQYATQLADRLWERDASGDDRTFCLECTGLQRSGHCFPASQGRIKGVSKEWRPVRDLLMRCEGFEWRKPA